MAQATIKGQVTDLMTDKPLPGVRVDLRTAENTAPVVYREVWTDARGRYRLDEVPAGRWRVRALLMMPDADRILVSPPAEISRKSISASTRMDLALLATGRPKLRLPVLGRVKDARGRNLDGISTSFKPTNGIGGQLSGRITRGDQPAADATIVLLNSPFYTRTDADGFFVFPRLPLRSYRFRVTHDGETLETPPLGIEAGPSEINFNLDQLPHGQE